MTSRLTRWGTALAPAAALLLANPLSAAAPHTFTVVIDKMKFAPLPDVVHKGDIIIWDNRDMFRHSATDKGVFDIDLPAGKAVRMRVTKTGTFHFICKYHPGMKAVLKVAE